MICLWTVPYFSLILRLISERSGWLSAAVRGRPMVLAARLRKEANARGGCGASKSSYVYLRFAFQSLVASAVHDVPVVSRWKGSSFVDARSVVGSYHISGCSVWNVAARWSTLLNDLSPDDF